MPLEEGTSTFKDIQRSQGQDHFQLGLTSPPQLLKAQVYGLSN